MTTTTKTAQGTTTVYGSENIKFNSSLLRSLHFNGVTRFKLHRGKWYDVQFSQAQNAVYASVSRVQGELDFSSTDFDSLEDMLQDTQDALDTISNGDF